MGETFMSISVRIDELLEKEKKIVEKAAALISDAVIGRIKERKVAMNMEKDIKNAIKGFSPEKQIDILAHAITLIGMNSGANISSSTYCDANEDDGSLRNSVFMGKRRRF